MMNLTRRSILTLRSKTFYAFLAISIAVSILTTNSFVSRAQGNSVGGSASGPGASATVRVLGVDTNLPLAAVAPVSLPPNGGSESDQVPEVNLGVPGLTVVQTGLITNTTSGNLSATSAHSQSSSTVDGLNMVNGLVTASNVVSMSTSDGNGSSALSNSTGSIVTGLIVAGTPYSNQQPPNTVIPINNYNIGLVSVSGTVTLNEQVVTGNGTTSSGLTVTQIHVNVSGSTLGGLTAVSIDAVACTAFSSVNLTAPPNGCPSLSVAGGTTRSVQVGQTLNFSVSATDPDGGTATLQASNLPANSTFTPNPASGTPTATGTFSFTPSALQALQTFNPSFIATDNQGCGGGTAIPVTVGITVTVIPPVNSCPGVSVTGGIVRSVQVGQTLSFSVSGTDGDGGTVTLQASNLPANSSFTPNPATGTPSATGTFSFTPTAAQALQIFSVSFAASDSQGCSGALAIPTVVVITVTPGTPENSCPNLSVAGGTTRSVQVGQSLSFSVSATDSDGGTVTLQASNLPANSSFTPNPASGNPTATGTFSFTPAAAQASQSFNVSFAASDNQGCSGAGAVQVTVAITVTPAPPVNNCPSVSVAGGTTRSVQVGQSLTFSVSATDPDGNTVTLQASSLPANATFNPNPASGTPTATGTFNFTPTSAQASQTFNVSFSASDNQGCSGAAAIATVVTITTTPAPPGNNCPNISVTGGTSQSVQVGQAISFSVSATDPDGNTVTLQASNLPANSTFSPNPASGTPTATGTFTFTPTSPQASQTFTVRFAATDGQGCGGAQAIPTVVSITVVPAPPGNNCPIVSVSGGTIRSVEPGQTLSFSVTATDPDGENVSLRASNLPANSTFSPNPASGAPTATGTFSFTPTAGQSGQTFNVSFSASDNQGCSGAVQFSATVGESQPGPVANPCGNHAPVISVPSMPMIGLGQTLKFAVRATDQDGDNVVVSAHSLPVGAVFDPASGSFTFTPTDSGVDMYRTKLGQSAEAIFLARDSNGAATMARVDIRVVMSAGNSRLHISVPPGPVLVKSSDELSFGVAVSSDGGCPVNVTASGLPSGATFDAATNMFRFTPDQDQVGSAFVVHFSATDCSGVTHQSAVRISVIDSDSACNARGTGSAEVAVRKLDFATASVGDRCGAAMVSITNRGGGSLVISSASLSDTTNFRVDGLAQLPVTVQPGGVIEFRVFFEPRSTGKATASLTVFTSDPNNPAPEIRLLGKAVK